MGFLVSKSRNNTSLVIVRVLDILRLRHTGRVAKVRGLQLYQPYKNVVLEIIKGSTKLIL